MNLFKKIKSIFTKEAKKDRTVIFAEYVGDIMTVRYSDGSESKFKGSISVWHEMPYMNRCGTYKEVWLCQLYEYCKHWKGTYPDAHKNKTI